MDYKKIYEQLIQKSKKENRKKGEGVYYENHHINPDFLFKDRKRKGNKGHLEGNPNDKDNLVLLTVREHVLSHILLCEIYKKTKYEHQCLTSLQLLTSKVNNIKGFKGIFNRNIIIETLKNSKLLSHYIEESKKSVSLRHKNKIVCKDVTTNKIIGSIEKTHPNIINGTWVHHTKGNKLTPEHKKRIGISGSGLKNSNSKGITDGQLLDSYKKTCLYFGFNETVSKPAWILFCEKFNEPYIKFFKEFRFNGDGFNDMIKITSEDLGLKCVVHSKLFCRKETKEKYLEIIKKLEKK